ncbi:MAG: hypothetical protein ACRDHV_06995 [Actinomycetota bacterium]
MELLPTAINAVVVAAVGLILGWLGKGRIDKLEARIDRLEQRLDGRIDRLEKRFDRLEERMDARFDSVRSDLTRIALAVGVRPEAEAGGG